MKKKSKQNFNKIVECNFNYLYDSPSAMELDFLINKLTNKYRPMFIKFKKINNKILLKFNKERYIELTKKYKASVIKLIKDVIDFFPQLSSIPHIVFIHGSFAKTLNRINSDIDLNILYPNKYKKLIIPIEELITIILQNVMEYDGRDKIHTMMIYTIDSVNTNQFESTLECTITFPNNQIYTYNCRPNYDEVMYKIKKSSREYKDFLNYIKENISDTNCREWCYSYEQLSSNCNYNIYKDLNIIDEKNLHKKNYKSFIYLLDNLLLEIENDKENLIILKRICDINQNLKVKKSKLIYNTLALIKRYLFLNGIVINGLDFFEIFENSKFINLFSETEIATIEDAIFKHLWQISRIENLFIKINVNFSSRNYDKFEINLINNHYKSLYNSDFILIQTKVNDDLYKSLKNVLLKLKGSVKYG